MLDALIPPVPYSLLRLLLTGRTCLVRPMAGRFCGTSPNPARGQSDFATCRDDESGRWRCERGVKIAISAREGLFLPKIHLIGPCVCLVLLVYVSCIGLFPERMTKGLIDSACCVVLQKLADLMKQEQALALCIVWSINWSQLATH